MNSSRQILDTSLQVIGGREKRVRYKFDEIGKRVKTRVTFMMEDIPIMIGSSLVNPITLCFPEIKDCFCQLAKVYGQGKV
jgi:hypothetical protein